MTCKFFLTLFMCTALVAVPAFADQDTGKDEPVTGVVSDADELQTDQLAEEKDEEAKDPNRGRFLPIPIFITEPAIGEGLGVALAYFHATEDKPQDKTVASPSSISAVSKDHAAPPTVTGVFGAYTTNDTAVAGIGHMNSFKDDHIRFTGLAAVADVYSTFYVQDQPFKFNLNGAFVYQETRFRLRDSGWFLGVGLSYLNATNTFEADLPDGAPVDLFAQDLTNVGLAGQLAWDTRDNTAMPNSGQLFELDIWRYDDAIGGDYDYWNANVKLLTFHQLHEKFVLGGRLESSAIDGHAPFYAIPWVKLRGIPALRYQGDKVVTAEIQGHYFFAPRWALIGFAGTGSVSSYEEFVDTEQNIYNYGLGARFNIFEAQNIWIGIDIARGPEDTNWYIQIGNSW